MKNRVSLFTVADPDIGLGHLFRCDALAFAFVKQNIPAELVIECKTGIDWIREKPLYSSWRLRNWTDDAACIEKELENCEIPVFDAYSVERSVWDAVRNSNRDVVVFDDYGEKPYFKGILINGSPGADLVGYKDLPGRQLLLGPSYQVLRPPFWEKTHRIIRRKVESVGIMLGGTDHSSISSKLLFLLCNNFSSDINFYLLGNSLSQNKFNNLHYIGFIDAKTVRKYFMSFDILISAAGQTLSESAACLLPTIMVKTIENQNNNYMGWGRFGFLLGGKSNDEDFNQNFKNAILSISSMKVRQEISSKCRDLDINLSTMRVVKYIFEGKFHENSI